MQDCWHPKTYLLYADLYILNSFDVIIDGSLFMCQYQQCGLVFDNVAGTI